MSGDDVRARRKRRVVSWIHRHLANPVARRTARFSRGQALIETTGRNSGLPRHTPVGGRVIDGSFWFISEHGHYAQYVRNIEASPRVRLQWRGRWYSGTAHPLPDDDIAARLRQLHGANSMMVRLVATKMLTIRVDLDR